MAQFVYIDETGSVGSGGRRQPQLILVAVGVNEDQVQPLSRALTEVAWTHLGFMPLDFEFHGFEIWNGQKHWMGKSEATRLQVYRDAIALLEAHDVQVAHSSINKAELHSQYNGLADKNAYRLALQFLLEKIDLGFGSANKVLVADEAREQQLQAMKMVADLQEWGVGEVPGHKLTRIIDCLHFVRSNASSGVQLADLVAFVVQRRRHRAQEGHPDAEKAMAWMHGQISMYTSTWREAWPPQRRRFV